MHIYIYIYIYIYIKQRIIRNIFDLKHFQNESLISAVENQQKIDVKIN